MEPDVKEFLIRILQSISMVLLWMMLNMTLGIYYGFAFFEQSPGWKNYLFDLFLIVTFIMLVIYLRRKWKGFKEITDR
jgi:membrane protein DedA with SNARE-associated domain